MRRRKTHDRRLTVGALARTDLSTLARVGELNERSAANNSETGVIGEQKCHPPRHSTLFPGKAMLERAMAALKANEAAALKAFNDEKNKDFRDRDLYVYCFSLPDGNITAYQSPVMIGTNVKELKVPRTIPLANAPTTRLQRPPKVRLLALPTTSPSLAPKRPRLRKRSKSVSASLRSQLFQGLRSTLRRRPAVW